LQSGASGDPALVLLELRSETGLSIARGASRFDYIVYRSQVVLDNLFGLGVCIGEII
jgi:hypothetical protein